MSTLIFILSVLSALVTGGIKFIENMNKADDYLQNGTKPNTEIEGTIENDSTK